MSARRSIEPEPGRNLIRSNGQEAHVLVSRDFKVAGAEQGGLRGGAPPAGQAAPSDSTQS